MTCIALASVKTSALLSSSDSLDKRTMVLGSLETRDNCGCTSELPSPIMRRRAVLSTLYKQKTIKEAIWHVSTLMTTWSYHNHRRQYSMCQHWWLSGHIIITGGNMACVNIDDYLAISSSQEAIWHISTLMTIWPYHHHRRQYGMCQHWWLSGHIIITRGNMAYANIDDYPALSSYNLVILYERN